MPSSSVHQRYQTTALRMIDAHGRNMSLLIPSEIGPAFNPVITWLPEAVVGVVTDYRLDEIDGELIQVNDKRILIAATGTVIDAAMRLTDELITYSIVSVTELKPGNTAILYTLQVRI